MTALAATGNGGQMTATEARAAGAPGRGERGIVVIGVGNEFRRDDGAGPAVIRRLLMRVPRHVELITTDGEAARLIEAWSGAALAIVVDAVRAVPPHPGRLHRLALDPAPARIGPASSHGLGLGEAIALAAALGRMPGRLVVHAVEAGDLSQGTGLSRAVAAAVDALADAVMRDIEDE